MEEKKGNKYMGLWQQPSNCGKMYSIAANSFQIISKSVLDYLLTDSAVVHQTSSCADTERRYF